ncbi:MAG: SRPBCC family protein [Crocinitomicaceae bacterium]|nr:SRPBCC family protein [Crocinitomicaceae bacterium]
MPRIRLETKINAPIQRVFDLSRSIDLHLITTREMREKVIEGRRKGLINKHEFVTWKWKIWGLPQRMTSAITTMARPYFFEDRMIKGPFNRLEHKHYFECSEKDKKTIMKDIFYYRPPFGILGTLVDQLFLRKYVERILKKRNQMIKDYAENDNKWMEILNIY